MIKRLSKKGQKEMGPAALLGIILIVVVLAMVLIFIFKVDILKHFRNLPSYDVEEEKVVDSESGVVGEVDDKKVNGAEVLSSNEPGYFYYVEIGNMMFGNDGPEICLEFPKTGEGVFDIVFGYRESNKKGWIDLYKLEIIDKDGRFVKNVEEDVWWGGDDEKRTQWKVDNEGEFSLKATFSREDDFKPENILGVIDRKIVVKEDCEN